MNNIEDNMNLVMKFERKIENYLDPTGGNYIPSIITYILEFDNEDEAEEFDNNIPDMDDSDSVGNYMESYLNYRIIQSIPLINFDDDSPLSENKAILIQNTVLESIATTEMHKAFCWLFEHLND